jgi:hypothetical protein
VPKRRRNPDGSLVTPLSPRQQENLARGRAALAARAAGEGEPASRKGPAKRGGAVEVVTVTKAKKPQVKAPARRPAKASSSPRRPAPPAQAGASDEGPGLLDRFARWLAST